MSGASVLDDLARVLLVGADGRVASAPVTGSTGILDLLAAHDPALSNL